MAGKRLIPRRVLPAVTEMPSSFVRLVGLLYEDWLAEQAALKENLIAAEPIVAGKRQESDK